MTLLASVVAYSQSAETGARIATFALEYPRTIHAELMTHRVFGRNASSSRAIPIKKMDQALEDNPFVPWHFLKNQPGMQGFEYVDDDTARAAKGLIEAHRIDSMRLARRLAEMGLHKQIYNRYTEAHQYIRVLVTSSTFRNFFLLRTDSMAEPHLQDLARLMVEELENAGPRVLDRGEWHLPYWNAGDEQELDKFLDQEPNPRWQQLLPDPHFIP